LDALFWEGLEKGRGDKGGEKGASAVTTTTAERAAPAAWAAVASTGAKYMDDVWISGHLSRKGVPRFAVPMDKDEPRARWSGGDGPTLEKVEGQGRRQMNDAALKTFRGAWDLLRCSPMSSSSSSSPLLPPPFPPPGERAAPIVACAGPVALLNVAAARGGTQRDAADLTARCQDTDPKDDDLDGK
jgi:hypothetical protein